MFSTEASHGLARKQIQTETRQGIVPNAISAVCFVLALKVRISVERKIRVNAFYCTFERWREDAARHRPNQTMYLQYTPLGIKLQAEKVIQGKFSSFTRGETAGRHAVLSEAISAVSAAVGQRGSRSCARASVAEGQRGAREKQWSMLV